MGSVDRLLLTYTLKKLTDVFIDFLLAKQAKTKGLVGEVSPMGPRASKSAAKVPKWLVQLSASKPFDVTDMLFLQMRKADSLNDSLRLEAQAALLEVLVVEGLAMDLISYSSRDT